ncbi:MAG: ABC transporter substrate-binding protein, partial [Bacteriovoracaceae bacterium]
KNDLSKVVVGTGPFYLAQVSQEKLVFKKNQNYRDEFYPSAGDRYANTQDLLTSSTERLPFLERVVFYFIDDEERRWEAFIDGKIDILSVPKKFLVKITEGDPDIEELLRQKEIKLKHFSSISSRWLGFNMSDPVLGKNLELRKALAHAIDYDGYIALMSNNTNLRANSIFNPGIPGYDPSHQMSYDYDLDKARAHLEKSGFSPGELTLTYTTRSNQQINYEEAEFIKNQLGKIGVNLKINVVQFSEFLARGRAGELQFFTDSWIYDYPDAENLAQLLVSSNSPGINKSAYNNLQVDKLYSELSKTLDKDKRRALMAKIENFVDKEIPWVMLMFESSYILHYPNIKNFRKSYFIRNHLKYLKKD